MKAGEGEDKNPLPIPVFRKKNEKNVYGIGNTVFLLVQNRILLVTVLFQPIKNVYN